MKILEVPVVHIDGYIVEMLKRLMILTLVISALFARSAVSWSAPKMINGASRNQMQPDVQSNKRDYVYEQGNMKFSELSSII